MSKLGSVTKQNKQIAYASNQGTAKRPNFCAELRRLSIASQIGE